MVRWEVYVARMGNLRYSYRIVVKNKPRDDPEEPGVDGRTVLRK
jgi:hypothetical protein